MMVVAGELRRIAYVERAAALVVAQVARHEIGRAA
jgi:hypothetical protein